MEGIVQLASVTSYRVMYWSLSDDTWVEFSRHGRREKAETIKEALMDFIADAPGRFTKVEVWIAL